MVDRHWLGDLGWAVLLALPLATFAWSQPLPGPTGAREKAAAITRFHSDARVSLLG